MSRRHFTKLAHILSQAYRFYGSNEDLPGPSGYSPRNAIDFIREEIESLCTRENPNFDVTRFRVACGFSEKDN